MKVTWSPQIVVSDYDLFPTSMIFFNIPVLIRTCTVIEALTIFTRAK